MKVISATPQAAPSARACPRCSGVIAATMPTIIPLHMPEYMTGIITSIAPSFMPTGKKKISPTGAVTDGAPQWNNPAAQVRAAMVDGSVRLNKTAEISQLARSADPAVNSIFRPSGVWNPSTPLLKDWLGYTPSRPNEVYNDPFENLTNDAWPAYYWATRNGIRGRDVQK